jgi:small subunit ribosomal protein S6e
MAEFKLVLSDPKTGKSLQREAKEGVAKSLIGKKIGEAIKGEMIDLPGYEFVITGGSDSSGFPMRSDVENLVRKKITAVSGIGVHNRLRKPNPKKKGWRKMKGMRLKKTVAGNMVHDKTAQVNMKVTKKGREPIFGEEPAEVKKEEKPAKADAKPKESKKPAAAPKESKKPAKEAPADNTEKKLFDEADALDKKAAKDAEDVETDDADIEEMEKELKKVDKEIEE